MLLAERIGFEVCAPDKRPVRLIYVTNTIHYIVRGRGYFNGVLLSEGDAFWTQKNRFVEYYPDPAEPWTYYWVHFNDDGFDAFLSDCRLPDCMYFHFPGYAQIIEFYRFFNSFPRNCCTTFSILLFTYTTITTSFFKDIFINFFCVFVW